MQKTHHLIVMENGRFTTVSGCTAKQAAVYCQASGQKIVSSFLRSEDCQTAFSEASQASNQTPCNLNFYAINY